MKGEGAHLAGWKLLVSKGFVPPVPKGHCRRKCRQIHGLFSLCSGNGLFAKQVLGFDYKPAVRDSGFGLRNFQNFNKQIFVEESLLLRQGFDMRLTSVSK